MSENFYNEDSCVELDEMRIIERMWYGTDKCHGTSRVTGIFKEEKLKNHQ